jgi:flagellin
MPIIGTNEASLSSALNYTKNVEATQRSTKRLAALSRLANPADDAAGVAVSGNLEALTRRLQATTENIGNVVSFAQTNDGYLSTIQSQVTRLSELAQRATDGTLNASDRAAVNVEFQAIQNQIGSITANADFNGQPVFINSSVTTTVDGNGSTASFTQSSTGNPSSLGLAPGLDVSTSANALAAIPVLNSAIATVTTRRAEVNADISVFNFYNTNAMTEKVNVMAANSRIKDLNVAEESVLLGVNRIREAASLSVLAQGNRLQSTSLRLLTS